MEPLLYTCQTINCDQRCSLSTLQVGRGYCQNCAPVMRALLAPAGDAQLVADTIARLDAIPGLPSRRGAGVMPCATCPQVAAPGCFTCASCGSRYVRQHRRLLRLVRLHDIVLAESVWRRLLGLRRST